MTKINTKHFIFTLFLLTLLIWRFGGQKQLWEFLFATPVTTPLTDSAPLDFNIRLFEQTSSQLIRIGKMDFMITLRGSAELTARVVYKDVYHNFRIGRTTPNVRLKEAYNTISPLDLSIMTGETAQDGNWQKFEIEHEYRLLAYRYTGNVTAHQEEISNLHIIPASVSVRRGMDLLKKGDIVNLKGFLVDWKSLGEFEDIPYRSALGTAEISDERAGGRTTGKCFYLYISQMTFDGWLYR